MKIIHRFVLAGLLLAVFGYLVVQLGALRIRIGLAEGQVALFHDLAKESLEDDGPSAAAHLEYVVQYYPEGTLHPKGSRLGAIVESVRQDVIRQMIARLRVVTREDLGDAPQPWVDAYARDDVIKTRQFPGNAKGF